ncbi:hypothetical protein VW29_06700 [Devosia limi DSM 17137]|uniref:DNA-3-methyladenine glycosylase II n=1 Tax=Devosia limi DSM 17137 TaxID=1121477 RepID=A0A0F5LSC1_9HYPH|nr:DNA-3-methyladenine glycosylase [Devosia limi]KKB85238.1 hypothetical protein VW29_06700 [Devosia limi DSM 17137]SHF87003.1 DNA-3-methyladenine glycosylase II [Devosia limi DSM 17137]
MSRSFPSPRLDSPDAIAVHLEHLVRLDPRLALVRERAGLVMPRIAEPGFAGIVRIICGQQLSVASANAIWGRFAAIDGALDPMGYLGLEEAVVRASGFSAGKFTTVRTIATAIANGELELSRLEDLPPEEAVAYLTAHKGIGQWTAEVYLMFCAGHQDVFPAGDLALQKAMVHGLGIEALPRIGQYRNIASAWAPHRAAAALLFWRYYAVLKSREGVVA